jgi:hypothetical protein
MPTPQPKWKSTNWLVHAKAQPEAWRSGYEAGRADSLRETEHLKAEFQRFYDFVGESDPALVDAWHFTQNVRAANE